MSKTIMRVAKNKDNPYLMLNKTSIQDERLSWKSKGLHAYLLSLPDDWKIYVEELIKHAKDGRDSTNAAIKELESFGYIEKIKLRGDKGKFAGYEYIIFETPKHDSPKTENPKTDKPKTENPQLLNNDLTNKLSKLNNNQSVNQDGLTDGQLYLFNQIILNAQIEMYYDDVKESIKSAILYCIRQGTDSIEKLKKLKQEHIDHALSRYTIVSENGTQIKSPVIYLSKCIMSSIDEFGICNLC